MFTGCLEERGPRQPTKYLHWTKQREDDATFLLQLTVSLETVSLEREENNKYVKQSLYASAVAAQHNLENNTICYAEACYLFQHQHTFIPAQQGQKQADLAPNIRCPSAASSTCTSRLIRRVHAVLVVHVHTEPMLKGTDSDRDTCGFRRLCTPRNLTYSTQPLKQWDGNNFTY